VQSKFLGVDIELPDFGRIQKVSSLARFVIETHRARANDEKLEHCHISRGLAALPIDCEADLHWKTIEQQI
jgi:hypothetical protein